MAIGKLYDIQRFAVNDGPGIRTNVFLKGCPLRCRWCHSPESQAFDYQLSFSLNKCIGNEICGRCINECPSNAIYAKDNGVGVDWEKCGSCMKCTLVCPDDAMRQVGYDMSIGECMDIIKKDSDYYCESGGVTISGGEPMSQFDFTFELASECKKKGFHVALDTSGYAYEIDFLKILPYINLFLFDIKHTDDDIHKKLTGVSNKIIISNAVRLAEEGAHFQIRIPVIPYCTDSEDNIEKTVNLCRKLSGFGNVDMIQLLPFHTLGISKYEKIGKDYRLNVKPPSTEKMNEIKSKFECTGAYVQIAK